MRSYGKRLVLIAGIGTLLACEESSGPTDTPTTLGLSAKPSAALYTYTFTGDIQGSLENVSAGTGDPFKQVSSGGMSFSFPATSTGNTAVCDQKNPELAASTNDWGGYDSAPWAGQIDLSRRKRSSFHIQITGSQTDGSGSINLAVNDTPVQDTNVGGTAVIRFEDARALVSALSFSDTDGGGAPIHDDRDRCVNFTITATRQP